MRSLSRFLTGLSLAALLVLPAAAQEAPARPDLAVQKSAYDEEVSVGKEAAFFIAVTNIGPGTATDVVVEDILPAGLHYIAARPTRGRYDAETGAWTLGPLAEGQSETLELTTLFAADTAVQNCAVVRASDDADATNDTDCAVVRPKREKMVPLAVRFAPPTLR